MTKVNQDLASQVYLPLTAAEWTQLLTGLSINNPSSYWLASQASGSSLADLGTGARTFTLFGSPTLGAATPGWTATGIQFTDGGAQYMTATIPNVSATSGLLLQIVVVNTTPASDRVLASIGNSDYEAAKLSSGNTGAKLKAVSVGNTSAGEQQYPATIVLVTKFDRASSVFGVYTRGERIKPTYTAPAGSTTLELMGHNIGSVACGATLIYAAFWSGSDAEISDAKIQTLIDAVYGDATTLSKMQAGSFTSKWVAAIEGCPYLLSDAPSASVLTAYAGTDWTQVLGGLYVECKNSQHITPWDPFVTGGSCTLRVVPDSADTFGVFVNKRAAGAETEITATIDRDDTSIAVSGTTDFASSGEVYIGTECVGYTSTDATHFLGCTRGKYSPLTAGTSGSGGNRFANHHRLGSDPYHVQMRPIVSEQPRVWVGKRVAVRLHTWDAINQSINSRDEAQLIFAGRIANIADDPNDFATVLDIEPITEEIRNGVIGKDLWAAEMATGITLVEGRSFLFFDGKQGSVDKTSNALTVVVGASGTNQIEPGRYSCGELCGKINAWLAGEKNAGRLYGTYGFSSPVTMNEGLRTRLDWRIDDASSTIDCHFAVMMPSEVCSFLGLKDTDPGSFGTTENWYKSGPINTNNIAQGDAVPFVNLVFKPTGPGRLGQEFSEIPPYPVENERGAFINQYDYLPANIKSVSDSSVEWGLFLLDEKALMVGSYDSGVLTRCWLAPFRLTADNDADANSYIGRRADEPESGPITLRQVFVLEATFAELMNTLIYGTGTSGYNHSTYDTLGYGLGLGIPGEVLGGSFERSLSNMPGASAPIAVIIDEPTKLVELFSADLVLRRSFLRWKDEAFEFSQWKTPLAAQSVAALPESTKAAPAGQVENHRVAGLESTEHARPIVKLDFCRDFAVGRDGQYLKSVQLEDQTAVDDLGGNVKPYTLKLRNTYGDLANTGSAIEALIPDFLAYMPVLARPFRLITRSIDSRFFEGYSVGDIVTVTDSFARDPLTGLRSINARAAMIARLSYDIGGPSPDGRAPRPAGGEVDLFFLDTHRGDLYGPTAQVDDTQANAGYTDVTKTLVCYAQKFSHNVTFTVRWGTHVRSYDIAEPADASNFAIGDKVLIIEIDPANPAAPDYWERTIASVSGNSIVLTSTLSAPAWSASKKYRVMFQKYSQVQASQLDYVFQADSADKMVENVEVPWHYSTTEEFYTFLPVSGL
jgi:hypothetical protein